jgi:DNA replicative helicase MCM subunit Mcm2 (Cdc46/Mcm family)
MYQVIGNARKLETLYEYSSPEKIDQVIGNARKLETLHNLAKARARLKLKDVVDPEDAKETVQYFGKVVNEYYRCTMIAPDPWYGDDGVAYATCCLAF